MKQWREWVCSLRRLFQMPSGAGQRWRAPWRRLACPFTWWGLGLLRRWRFRSRRDVVAWRPPPDLSLPVTILSADTLNQVVERVVGSLPNAIWFEAFARERAVRSCVDLSTALVGLEGCSRVEILSAANAPVLWTADLNSHRVPEAVREYILLLRTREYRHAPDASEQLAET